MQPKDRRGDGGVGRGAQAGDKMDVYQVSPPCWRCDRVNKLTDFYFYCCCCGSAMLAVNRHACMNSPVVCHGGMIVGLVPMI